MDYQELSKAFYQSTSADRFAELDEQARYRRAMPSSFDLGIETSNGPLFIAMPRELFVLYEQILRTERKVSSLMRSLPPIARMALVRGLVFDEVVSSNAIEEIHSTRAQVKEALDMRTMQDNEFRRFKELAQLYLELGKAEREMPRTIQEIRAIYDKIMDGELPESKLPDGEVFRADGVDVTAGGIKVIHRGLEPESKIIEVMEAMLRLMQRDDMPEMVSALASHYLFEYAHPFYDGNGRTGRYLLALFLSEALSVPTVLSLSRAIAENRNVYYRAFTSVENALNRAEMTFFIYDLLTLVRIAQVNIHERLLKSKEAFGAIEERMGSLVREQDLGDKEGSIVFVLAQFELFGMYGTATIDELARNIDLGKQMTRKHLASLEAAKLVWRVKARPAEFALTDHARRLLGMAEASAPEGV